MIAIEIIMLIIGIAAVIASFRLSDEKETDNTKSNIDAEELEEKIKDAVKETEDYIITKADEKSNNNPDAGCRNRSGIMYGSKSES